MKVFLIVLGVIAVVIMLISLIPVSIELEYFDSFKYKIKLWFFELKLKNKPKKKKRSSSKSIKSKNEVIQEKKKTDIKEIFNIIIDFLKEFKWKLNIIVSKLNVYISCADEDAAQAAIKFGEINAYAYTVDAMLKSLFKIRESNINISVDYNSSKIRFAGEIALFARLGKILLALIRLLVYLIVNKEKLSPILDLLNKKDGVN